MKPKPVIAALRSVRVKILRSPVPYIALGIVLLAAGLLVLFSPRRRAQNEGPTFVFVFSTGRCGTQHLARTLLSAANPRAYITHEEEHMTQRARDVVARVYRSWVSLNSEDEFNTTASKYLEAVKAPYWSLLLQKHQATHLVYTGHLPSAWGLAPQLVSLLGERVKFVRLRRDRIMTAASLMALGPANEDPWGFNPQRWFPTPRAKWTRLRITQSAWAELNRFQRWLWYVDDMECRWQALRRMLRPKKVHETSLEALDVLDGGQAWRELAEFAGVRYMRTAARERHNSIQAKGRQKQGDEALLRQWDMEYRAKVGLCVLDESTTISW